MNKLVDLTKPVQTRAGNSVRILCTDAEDGNTYPVVTLVKVGGSEVVYRYNSVGGYYNSGGEDPNDLVNVPVKHQRTGWINCYKISGRLHATKEDADVLRGSDCLACVPVTFTFEEGDGL